MLKRLWNKLRRLASDEQGATMIEYILIVAAVALPLLAVIIIFRNAIWEKISSMWEDISGDMDVPE